MKKFFLLVIAAVAIYLVYLQFYTRDYTKECVAISDAVDGILLASGYTDADVTSQYRRYVKKGNSTWVEFNKTLARGFQPDGKEMEALKSMVSGRKGFTITRKKISDTEEAVFIGIKDKVFYILKFPSGAISSAGKISPSVQNHKVAIVIDDLGYKFPLPEEFLSLEIPLTFAILPMERHSKDIADFLASKRMDYIIHFPMQPENPFENPGHAAVLLNMDEKEIAHKFNNAIKSVPGAFVISNHMGSAFSRSEEKMEIFLSFVKEKKLVYFDSHTSVKSVAARVGKKLGVPVLVNQFFLDNEDTPQAIEKELQRVLAHARKHPVTIAIGHIHKKNLAAALKKYIPQFRREHIEFVPLKGLYTTGE